MNTPSFLLSFICSLCLILSCQVKPEGPMTQEESPAKDRDMFGLAMKRGLTINKEEQRPGYAMFCVPNSALTYLVNREGQVLHQWKGNYGAFNAYLMDDGSIIRGVQDPDYPVFDDTGPYGRIQKTSWGGKMLWDFEYATEEYIAHHDIAVLPNGNVLVIAYEVMPYEEAITNGRKSEMVPKDGPWLEKILEIKPKGKYGGDVVWEWHLSDHLIQDLDPAKSNYGSLHLHPELMNFNLGHHLPPEITQDSVDVLIAEGKSHRNTTAGNRGAGIFHFNAINYHAALDQIAISSPEICEVIIIDHSTTTAEAASHRGGNSGRGGDILYRWGNPQNYNRGDSTDQMLFYQHDVRWIETGKPGAGNLTIYNNSVPGGPDSLAYSAVYEISPPLQADGSYALEEGKPYGPIGVAWKYIALDTVSFHSSFISGAHRMDNGNTFINEGARGRMFEVTPKGEIVWEYLNPFRGEIRKPNGDPNPLMPMVYSLFRSTFIPADHTALVSVDLVPLDPQPVEFVLPPPAPKQ